MPQFIPRRLIPSEFNKLSDTICRKRGLVTKSPDPRVFKVYRFPGILSNEKPKVQTFSFDVSKIGGMVLDALIKMKEMDPSLTFKRSCREGICGSCGITLQGSNCLSCITPIPKKKVINIMPLPHMYVIKDLVVDLKHFLDQYRSIRPYLARTKSIPPGQNQYAQSKDDAEKMIGAYECVLCACCSTSCPSYWWNGRRFLGPASLLQAYRWIIDSRDEDTERRLKDLSDDFKVFRCHTIMNCSLVCPKGLNPAVHIATLKRLISEMESRPLPQMNPMKFVDSSESSQACGM